MIQNDYKWEEKMKFKAKNKFIKKGSIKVKLLIIPIMMVLLSIAGIGLISSNTSRASLINQMNTNGDFILKEFVNRLGDNATSLEVINNTIEDQIRGVAKATTGLKGELSNERITQLAMDLGVDQILYYSPEGVARSMMMNL